MTPEEKEEERKKLAISAREHHVKVNVGDYAGLLGRACPASVYEYVDAEEGEPGSWGGKKLVINSQVSLSMLSNVCIIVAHMISLFLVLI